MEETKSKHQKILYTPKKFTWIDINDPTPAETAYLKRHYKFHDLDLEDCLSVSERPKIDDYDDYLFIVLHIPQRRKGKIISGELNLFIGQNYFITLHEGNPIIGKLFEKCKKSKKTKEHYMGKGSGYLLYLLIDSLFESGFPLVDELNKQLNEIEMEVFDRDYSQDRLKDILVLKKDIINFRRFIMPQRAIIAQLEHKNKKFLPENLDVYFDDVVDKIEKMWNSLENLQELTASVQETNESIISHNTNNVIKILTVFSVVMLPLSVITGFYGMNVKGLPFVGHTSPVLIISAILLTVAVVMIGFFKYKKWI